MITLFSSYTDHRDQAYDACEGEHAPQRDHNYHPELLYRLADLVGAYVHPQSAEVAMGRWMLEVIELDFYQGP